MSYCTPGEHPKVNYEFADQQASTYQSNIAPIDVETGTNSENTTSNYNPEGYQITFNSPQGQYGTITLTVVDYQINYVNRGVFDSDTGYYIKVIPCGSNSFPTDDAAGIKMTSSNVNVNNAVKCPITNPISNLCYIKISNKGNLIFQAQGKCPVNYTVACGDECPNGYCKIDCETYPGYCCINEAEIQGLINQLNS